MGMTSRVCAIAVLVGIALPVAAQLAVPAHIVPVIAKNGGVGGADWKAYTDLCGEPVGMSAGSLRLFFE